MKVDLFNILFKEIINDLNYGIVLFGKDHIIYANTKAREILKIEQKDNDMPTIFGIIHQNFPEIFEQFELSFLKMPTTEISSFALSNVTKQQNINKVVSIRVSTIQNENEIYFLMEINNPPEQIRELIKRDQIEIEKLKREFFKSQQTINNSYQMIEKIRKERNALQIKISKLEQEITFLEKQLSKISMERTLSQLSHL